MLVPLNEDEADGDEDEDEDEDGDEKKKTNGSNNSEEEENMNNFFTYEYYSWALGTLWSRGHDFIRGKNEKFRCILPGIDLLNMATNNKEPNVEVRLSGNRVDLVSIEDVKEGDELRVVYNTNLPNNRLLHLHGFVVHPNNLSYVELYCDLSNSAPLYNEKMMILKDVYTPGVPFQLKLDDPIPTTLLFTLAVQRSATKGMYNLLQFVIIEEKIFLKFLIIFLLLLFLLLFYCRGNDVNC